MLLQGHFQNAYVTRELDRTVEQFRASYGIQDWMVYEGELNVSTPAGQGALVNKVAVGWVGNLQYELIQPVSGLTGLYAEALRDDAGLRFHHVCMRVADLDAARREVERLNLPIVLEGETVVRFFYADARATFGHYLEYVQMPDEIWAMMGGR